MRPSRRALLDGLDADPRLRVTERRRILRIAKAHGRTPFVTRVRDLAILVALYVVGYVGAGTYWTTLNALWHPRWVQMFAPFGHAIPAVIAGFYTGVLFRRRRPFFLMGPLMLVAATFIREVWLPLGTAQAAVLPVWMYWTACAQGLISGGLAMLLGVWAGIAGD